MEKQNVEFEEYPHFFEVELDHFGGPIDLLLHLVKSNELPLDELSLAQVTGQYLKCLERMKSFDLEIAGEYLVIAATLVSLKSALLLGRPIEPQLNEDGELVNPHDELLRRLREAAVYKEGAEKLSSRAMLHRDVFTSDPRRIKGVKPVLQFQPHDPILLGKAFRKILAEAGELEEGVYQVQVDSVSIVDRMMTVLDRLGKAPEGLSLPDLIPDLTSRLEIVATLISLLELCKRQAISVVQPEIDGEIFVRKAADLAEGEQLDSEFESALPDSEHRKEAKVAVNGSPIADDFSAPDPGITEEMING